MTQHSVEVFVGGFSLKERPPPLTLVLQPEERHIDVADWRIIEGGRSSPIYWWATTLEGLRANTAHVLELLWGGRGVASAQVQTLPERLPLGDTGSGGQRPFTIWLSSCYSVRRSPEGLGAMLERVLSDARERPHFRCLVGDQVYLDELWMFIYSARSATRLRTRFNEQYTRTFSHPEFGQLLRACGGIFLPDDHELWNNYPDAPFGVPLRGRRFWQMWLELAFHERCRPIQNPRVTDIVKIGRDVSLFVAD
ncbi:MAG TPA: hypothetical protein VK524_05695, partial [Polyangiaceae bacterium]|nr:hypothetical protein [Polyangiaceae bacterium]